VESKLLILKKVCNGTQISWLLLLQDTTLLSGVHSPKG